MIGAVGFWFTFRNADKEEDAMNNLKESTFVGRKSVDEESEGGVIQETAPVKSEKTTV